MRVCVVIAGLFLFASVSSAATVDPPLNLNATKVDGTALNGKVISYDDNGFDIMDAQKKTQTITWDQLPAQKVFTINTQVNRKPSADDWIKLGKMLLTMPGGRAVGEQSFQRAIKLDPKRKGEIDQARKEALEKPPPQAKTPAADVLVLYGACRWYASLKRQKPRAWMRYI